MLIDGVIANNELVVSASVRGKTNTNAYLGANRGLSNTYGFNSEKITSIQLFGYQGREIKAGSVILLKRK